MNWNRALAWLFAAIAMGMVLIAIIAGLTGSWAQT